MFCQLDTLRQCLPSSVRQTLEELPESLDETYERIVADIKKANKGQAYRMLQFLAVAIRPLRVAELAELLAFDFDAAKGRIPKLNSNWRWEDHEQAVLSTCSSLITVVPTDDSPVVHFSHFSVKVFLMSDRVTTSAKDISRYHIVLEDANTLIARACLGALLRDPVDESAVAAPLALYAATYWPTHARVENVASRIRDGMETLFDPDKPYFSAWAKLYNVDPLHGDWFPDAQLKIQPGAAPLYSAALCGFLEMVEHLVFKYPQYANAIGGDGGTALHAASRRGRIEVVRSLLKHGVDVDARGRWGQSPLQFASLLRHLDVVQCLLAHGADANFRDSAHKTPLYQAAVEGYSEIVRVLLDHNADVNSQDEDGWTPLHRIFLGSRVEGDYSQVVRLLLEHGANPNARDNQRRTPLHLASSSEWEMFSSEYLVPSWRLEVTRILLTHGADVKAKDEEGRTPMQVALAKGQSELVQLLSEYYSRGTRM